MKDIEVKEKLNEFLKCKICNREFKSLIGFCNHISSHKISSKNYYDIFLKDENEGICKMYGKISSCKQFATFCSLNKGYRKYCSARCSSSDYEVQEKLKRTCKERYGVEHMLQSQISQAKFRKTCRERFGVENPSQKYEIQEKKKETSLKNNGFDNPFKSPNIKKKIKETCRERYGVENPSQKPEIRKKQSDTCRERYGVENPSQKLEFREKKKETCRERYGVDNPSQKLEFREKQKKTFKKNFLKKYIKKLKKLNLKFLDYEYTNLYFMNNLKCLLCNYNFKLSYHLVKKGYLCPKCFPQTIKIATSKTEKNLLEFVKSLTSEAIQENTKNILVNKKNHRKNQELDIYISKLGLAVEFNGLYWHSEDFLKSKDYHLNKTLKCSNLGIRLIHIFEDEWYYDKEGIKVLLRKIIKEDWDLLPKHGFHSISLNRRFCKSPVYYEKLGFEVEVTKPRLYPNKYNLKVWDCGFLTLYRKGKL